MPKFRHKPTEVEGIRVAEALKSAASAWVKLPKWLQDAYEKGKVLFGASQIQIQGGHGSWSGAGPNDWIIHGLDGELYPCPNEILLKAYDEVPA